MHLAAGLRPDPLGGEVELNSTRKTPALSDRERVLKKDGAKKEEMRKNKWEKKSIVVPQNLILLSLLLQTSDIHALLVHKLVYNTAFCCPPPTFWSGSTPLVLIHINAFGYG